MYTNGTQRDHWEFPRPMGLVRSIRLMGTHEIHGTHKTNGANGVLIKLRETSGDS